MSSHSNVTRACVEAGAFRKASFSQHNGNCVEVGTFRKASFSEAGNCVEAGHGPGVIAIRDTARRDGVLLEVTPAAWRALLGKVRGS